MLMYFYQIIIINIKAGLTTNPDYSQGSITGGGHAPHLADSPTTNFQYLKFPWQGQPYDVWLKKPSFLLYSFSLPKKIYQLSTAFIHDSFVECALSARMLTLFFKIVNRDFWKWK